MYGLDLFSGIGGLTVALRGYVEPIAYCENDRYAQAMLLSRIADGDLPAAPIWDDVRTLRGDNLCRSPEIIYGGFPCQDISVAGRGAGLGGERSGLFFEIVRLVSEIRPRFVFLENVAAITTRGGVRVIADLAALGYDCRWNMLRAADLGAPHLRERWFMVAHSAKLSAGDKSERFTSRKVNDATEVAATSRTRFARCDWWSTEPSVDRVAHGLPFRVDRANALGNAVVPAQAREAFERLMGIKIKEAL